MPGNARMGADGVGAAPERPALLAFTGKIGASQNVFDVFRVMRLLANEYDFLYFLVVKLAFGEQPSLGGLSVINNLPPEIIGEYDACCMFKDSRIARKLRESAAPMFFSKLGYENDETLDDRALRKIEMFENIEFVNCVFFPVHTSGSTKGAVGFGGNRPEPSSQEMMELNWLSALIFEKLNELTNIDNKSAPILSDREKECIFWTAAGKTSPEIATILNISPHTVDHHITSASAKLNTVNRAHTVAAAIRLGLLE